MEAQQGSLRIGSKVTLLLGDPAIPPVFVTGLPLLCTLAMTTLLSWENWGTSNPQYAYTSLEITGDSGGRLSLKHISIDNSGFSMVPLNLRHIQEGKSMSMSYECFQRKTKNFSEAYWIRNIRILTWKLIIQPLWSNTLQILIGAQMEKLESGRWVVSMFISVWCYTTALQNPTTEGETQRISVLLLTTACASAIIHIKWYKHTYIHKQTSQPASPPKS